MNSAFEGMDTEAARLVSQHMRDVAQRVEESGLDLQSSVAGVPWYGHDREEHVEAWGTFMSSSLAPALEELRALADELDRNAEEQDSTSASSNA